MKLSLIFAALFLSATISFDASAAEPVAPSLKAPDAGPQKMLSWRCGKNNPAMWGTFGNGCLKQKRKAKKGNSAAFKNNRGLKVAR